MLQKGEATTFAEEEYKKAPMGEIVQDAYHGEEDAKQKSLVGGVRVLWPYEGVEFRG